MAKRQKKEEARLMAVICSVLIPLLLLLLPSPPRAHSINNPAAAMETDQEEEAARFVLLEAELPYLADYLLTIYFIHSLLTLSITLCLCFDSKSNRPRNLMKLFFFFLNRLFFLGMVAIFLNRLVRMNQTSPDFSKHPSDFAMTLVLVLVLVLVHANCF